MPSNNKGVGLNTGGTKKTEGVTTGKTHEKWSGPLGAVLA